MAEPAQSSSSAIGQGVVIGTETDYFEDVSVVISQGKKLILFTVY